MQRLRLEYLPLKNIDISRMNARRTNPDEGIDELAQSIEAIGVQQPVVVFPRGDRYELIIGQRRYLACRKLNLPDIPALIIRAPTDTEAAVISFSENIHRLDLGYRDKMEVAGELLGKLSSVDKVAEALGVTSQTVRNYLGYRAVPESIKQMVEQKKLSATTATRIARNIPDEEMATRIAEAVREAPRSEDREKIIEVARENPDKSPDEIIQIAKRSKFTKVTIDLTPRVADALGQACKAYGSDRKAIATWAIEEWLGRRGFI